jgi:zinc protease
MMCSNVAKVLDKVMMACHRLGATRKYVSNCTVDLCFPLSSLVIRQINPLQVSTLDLRYLWTRMGLGLSLQSNVLLAALSSSSDVLPAALSMNTLTRGVQKSVLGNGLTVLTKEIHTAPVVSVQVWYRVGARNETAGINGISHQLEHLLFKGTQARPIQFGRLFSAIGSASNAFTSYDMTAYFGTVGSDKLEALLTLEADRMRHALIGDEQLESEKRVVISELQGYDNSPEYRLSEAVMRQAFPGQPYGLPVGGTKTDVEGFTVKQVREYYQTYYCPENAVLAVTGDFEPQKLQGWIDQTFAQIPASRPTSSDSPSFAVLASTPKEIERNGQAPVHLREPGSVPLLESIYPVPNVTHPDIPALDVLDAILSVGRHSRFYQALIEPGLVSQIQSSTAALIEPGWYNISLMVAPGQTLEAVDQVLQDIIASLQRQSVSAAALQRAKNQLRAHFVMSNRDIDNQASQLAYNYIMTGDHCYSDRYLAAIEQVTVADIQRVAQTYLSSTQRTVGYFEPTQPNGHGMPGGFSTQQTAEDFSPGEPVDPAVVAQYLPPLSAAPTSHSQALPEQYILANGLRVLLLPDHSSPTITLTGQVGAGNGFDQLAKAGVASLTAETLMGGTAHQNALEIAQPLEDRGAGLDFTAFREGVEIDGYALAGDLEILLKTLGLVLQEASFPESELELARQQAIAGLQADLDDPARLGRRTLQQKLYPPEHPFHVFATVESLQAITREDILGFYQQRYTPGNTILALIGDFDPAQVQTQLARHLGDWAVGDATTLPPLSISTVDLPVAFQQIQVPLPGKSQAITFMGYPGIRRRDPQFYAALILNQILGGDTLSSRLGTEIRDRQGLTYGIYSYFAAGQQAGPFTIEMQTAPEDTERAIQSTLALLRQLRDQGVTAAELKTAKRSLINSYPVELANPDIVAQRILMNAVDGFGLEEIRDFPARINAITLDQIEAAIHSLIHPDRLLVVTAGPTATES